MSLEEQTNKLQRLKQIALIIGGLGTVGGLIGTGVHQVYQWGHDSGFNKAQAESTGVDPELLKAKEKEIKKLKRKLNKCQKKET
jgi:hypothetical protein